jgi:hypothetical protein
VADGGSVQSTLRHGGAERRAWEATQVSWVSRSDRGTGIAASSWTAVHAVRFKLEGEKGGGVDLVSTCC